MSLLSRIAKKISRRLRPKGVVVTRMKDPKRNWYGITAVDLWHRSFPFKETPPARAGVRRAKRRMQKKRAFFPF